MTASRSHLLRWISIATLLIVMVYVASYLWVRVDRQWKGEYTYYRYWSAYYFYRPLQVIDQWMTGLESIEPFEDEWFPSNVRY